MSIPLFSDNGAVAIHEQTGEGLHQLDPYDLLDLTSFTAETDPTVLSSDSLAAYRRGARISAEAASGTFDLEAKRGTEVDKVIAGFLQSASLTPPADLLFVGAADYAVEIGVVFGGVSPPPGSAPPTGTRLVAPSNTWLTLYGQTGRPFRMYGWANAENGSTTPKYVILLRAWEDPDGLGPATPGSVLELLPASTGGVGAAFVAGSYGAPMVGTSGDSPTLDFGSFRPFEETGAGTKRNWSVLVKNKDGVGTGEWGGIERVVMSDFNLDAAGDSNLTYSVSFMGKKTTTHEDASPANPAGDEFDPLVLTEHASVNIDTVVTALLTEVTDFPIVFACDRGVSLGFTAAVASNNTQSTGNVCRYPSGVARGRKDPDLTLSTRMHEKVDEDYYGRITRLGDEATQEDAACQYLLSWPNKSSTSTRKHTISWFWARTTIPKVFYDFAGAGSFLDEDVPMTAHQFANYNNEYATYNYVVWQEGS